jgi:hypothetical protein
MFRSGVLDDDDDNVVVAAANPPAGGRKQRREGGTSAGGIVGWLEWLGKGVLAVVLEILEA